MEFTELQCFSSVVHVLNDGLIHHPISRSAVGAFTTMGPKKRSLPDQHKLEDLVVKHARIEESGETNIM